jgi:predicted 3-demethylubiquinone-9 3-methyltransferase (glyoxalase superfamily)
MQKLTPCLWFDKNAEEAAKFYVAIFKNAKITAVTRYGDAGAKASGMPKGSAMTVSFKLFGQNFLGLNGGPIFKFSPAVSFIVNCENQREIDRYWEKLCEGGQPSQCGWLTDKFGLSWQIVPSALGKMMTDKDPKRGEKVMAELMKMTKIDLKILKQAYLKK